MSSFKLESGGSAKHQAKSAGILLIVLGIAIYLLVDIGLGFLMGVVGVVALLAGLGASD